MAFWGIADACTIMNIENERIVDWRIRARHLSPDCLSGYLQYYLDEPKTNEIITLLSILSNIIDP